MYITKQSVFLNPTQHALYHPGKFFSIPEDSVTDWNLPFAHKPPNLPDQEVSADLSI